MVPLKDLIKVAILSSTTSALILLGGYLVLAQTGSWSEPTAAPPGDNALAPLNAGPSGQSKSGGLILNTGGAPNGLIVNSGATSLGGQLSMNSNKITNLATPSDTADAVNLGYLQSYVSAQSGGGTPGNWTCTTRSSPPTSPPGATVTCASNERLITGGCSFYDSQGRETERYTGGHPINDQTSGAAGWRCNLVSTERVVSHAYCCY